MTPTHYRIEGLENRTIEVYLAGSDSPTQITLDAKGEAMQQAGVPVGIVAEDRLRRYAIRDRAGGEQPDQPPDRRRESSLPRGGRQGLHPRQHDRRTEDDRPRRRQPGADTSSRATSTCSTPSGRRSRNWRASMTAATSPSPASGFRSGTAMPGSSQPTAGRSATS